MEYDATKISWTDMFLKDAENNVPYEIDEKKFCDALYRPFSKLRLSYEKQFLQRTYQQTKIFPTGEYENLVICCEGTGSNKDFGCLITDKISDLGFAGIHTQCFPLYWYEEIKQQNTLFDAAPEQGGGKYARRDAISDFALTQARKLYGSKTTKEDIFYYVYGFLHNPDYRAEFVADLKKMLPRIPLVGDSTVFWRYAKAGRELADLHLHYEDAGKPAGVVEMYNPLTVADTLTQLGEREMEYLNFRVEKMRFPSKTDRSKIIYNRQITIENIPAEAYDYVVNGKSAIEWIMERYAITTHKESGIVNDPNDWAREHNHPRYILDLLLSVITLSVRTVEIVKQLPKVEL